MVIRKAENRHLDYNMWSGKPRYYKVLDEILLDEKEGIEKPEWKENLIEFAIDCGLNEQGQYGYKAWIIWLNEEGLLELK